MGVVSVKTSRTARGGGGDKTSRTTASAYRGSDLITRDELDVRLAFELQQRRVTVRGRLIQLVKNKYAEVTELLECNIRCWQRREGMLGPQEELLNTIRKKYLDIHTQESQEVAAKKPFVTVAEYDRLEKQLKKWMVPVRAAELRIENLRNIRWWITQLLRTCYRRKAALEVSEAPRNVRMV
jgi:hypothetical protein